MKKGYYAGIDIGTNAARLVIKDVFIGKDNDIKMVEVQKLRIPLRLGIDVFKDGNISKKKEEQLILTMECYKRLIDIYSCIDYKAYATSAMREASNGEEIIKTIKERVGLNVELVTGEMEAKTISKIASNIKSDDEYLVFIDVGGGSVEVTLVKNKKSLESYSFKLGTLRCLAHKDKEEEWAKFKDLLKKYEDKYGNLNIVGSGGNINRYWKMSSKKEKKDCGYLEIEELEEIYDEIIKKSVFQRIEDYNIKGDRADVIIPAGNVFLTAAKILDSKYIIVPFTGLSDGIIDNLVLEDNNVI